MLNWVNNCFPFLFTWGGVFRLEFLGFFFQSISNKGQKYKLYFLIFYLEYYLMWYRFALCIDISTGKFYCKFTLCIDISSGRFHHKFALCIDISSGRFHRKFVLCIDISFGRFHHQCTLCINITSGTVSYDVGHHRLCVSFASQFQWHQWVSAT